MLSTGPGKLKQSWENSKGNNESGRIKGRGKGG
jgi:hypothetical protein